jgi:hypothetical protein
VSFRLDLKGLSKIQRQLKGLAKRFPRATAAALYAESFAIQAEATRRAPISEGGGVLRTSAYTAPPTGRELATETGFGTVYAARQHEETTWKHPRGGEAKYLTNAVNARMKGMLARLKARIWSNVARGRGSDSITPLGPTRPQVKGERRRKGLAARVRRARKGRK